MVKDFETVLDGLDDVISQLYWRECDADCQEDIDGWHELRMKAVDAYNYLMRMERDEHYE